MKRIILADDHAYVRLGLIQILKDGYPSAEIKEVADGEELIREVSLHNWDLVISDLDMPGRSGLEALEQIKLIRPNLPVLILSMYAEELYAVRVYSAGASGYLNKNSAPFELINAVERILSGKKYVTPDLMDILLDKKGDKNPHQTLTNKEFDIFKLLALGKTITQIAQALSLAPTTISTHRSRIMQKFNMHTNSELTRYAITHGIISEINQ
jgi:DNA-binding NarL/FixJ family response regulator